MKIEELNNPPQWLLDADTEGADVMLVNDEVFWFDGIWKGGKWFGGVWLGGTFKGGNWFSGEFRNGVWEDGVFWGGTWYEGEWRGGIWHRGLRFTFNPPQIVESDSEPSLWLNLTGKEGKVNIRGQQILDGVRHGEYTIEQIKRKYKISSTDYTLLQAAANNN